MHCHAVVGAAATGFGCVPGHAPRLLATRTPRERPTMMLGARTLPRPTAGAHKPEWVHPCHCCRATNRHTHTPAGCTPPTSRGDATVAAPAPAHRAPPATHASCCRPNRPGRCVGICACAATARRTTHTHTQQARSSRWLMGGAAAPAGWVAAATHPPWGKRREYDTQGSQVITDLSTN